MLFVIDHWNLWILCSICKIFFQSMRIFGQNFFFWKKRLINFFNFLKKSTWKKMKWKRKMKKNLNACVCSGISVEFYSFFFLYENPVTSSSSMNLLLFFPLPPHPRFFSSICYHLTGVDLARNDVYHFHHQWSTLTEFFFGGF